jgi:hypothetical protein
MFVRNVYLGWEIEREGYTLNVLMEQLHLSFKKYLNEGSGRRSSTLALGGVRLAVYVGNTISG